MCLKMFEDIGLKNTVFSIKRFCCRIIDLREEGVNER